MFQAEFTPLPSTIEVPEHGTHTIIGKRRNIWLWSDTPNTGKTTWAKSLDQYGTHWYGYKEHF